MFSTAYFTWSEIERFVLDPLAKLIKFKPKSLASNDPYGSSFKL